MPRRRVRRPFIVYHSLAVHPPSLETVAEIRMHSTAVVPQWTLLADALAGKNSWAQKKFKIAQRRNLKLRKGARILKTF